MLRLSAFSEVRRMLEAHRIPHLRWRRWVLLYTTENIAKKIDRMHGNPRLR
jgi:hypothetical protein